MISIKHPFRLTQTCLFFLAFFFILPTLETVAQKKATKRKIPQLDIECRLATIYDNNILKYSEKYLDRFRNKEDEGRFHIHTYDDVLLVPSLEISSTFNIFKKLKSKINAEYIRRQYLKNDIKTWDYISLGFQQNISKRATFKLSYNYIPHFYVRHFRDRQWVELYGYTPETFQPFAFTKNEYEFFIQNTFFKNTRIRFTLAKVSYFHNKHFTEYDCNNVSSGITLYQPLHKKVKFEITYEFIKSRAKGYDASFETKETSTGADASYEEDGVNALINWKLPTLFKRDHEIEAECGYGKRYYSSKRPLELDEEHAGRADDNLSLFFTYSINLKKQLKLSAFYYWYSRNTETSAVVNQTYLSDEKDYNQSLVGLKITYKLKI